MIGPGSDKKGNFVFDQQIETMFFFFMFQGCHKTFKYQEWLEAKPSEGMNILYTGEYLQAYGHKVHIFI